MENLDLRYICTQMGNLSGVPIRIFRGEETVFFHTTTGLNADPAVLYRDALLSVPGNIGYVSTEDFQYFGVVRTKDLIIAVGPTRQIPCTDQELRTLAFRLDVPKEELDGFLASMKSIVRMPLESIMQMLCVENYVLNGEKVELETLMVRAPEQIRMKQRTETGRTKEIEHLSPDPNETPLHNTLSIENDLLGFVRRGDAEGFRNWIRHAPAVRGGTLAADQLRQRKNTFIVTATLVSRAAIQGGLDAEEALSLSDQFIQRCELLQSPDQIMGLHYHMVLEFTERVESVRRDAEPTKLSLAVSNYIRHHLSEAITAKDIAKALYLSRPYLSSKFRQETGETLTDRILREKTEEAKRLLRYSDKSAAAIGDYLGFSSQSHFSRTFLKYAGVTPKAYRQQGQNG